MKLWINISGYQMYLVFVLFLFACISISEEKEKKYYIIIERTSRSLLTNQEESESRIDSVFATSDENAYDSCMGILFGIRIADTVLMNALQKAGHNKDDQYYRRKLKGYRIINDSGLDVTNNISDSVKNRLQAKWNHGLYD